MKRFSRLLKATCVAFGVATVLSFGQNALAQSQDIMILPLQKTADGFSVSLKPIHVTQREGYDNQPRFSPDGKRLYFTRMVDNKSGEGQQSDIFSYDIYNGAVVNVTQTDNISEYSATAYSEGKISVIAVNPQGQQHLRLVTTKTRQQEVLREDIEPVGYYGWMNSSKAGVFVLGDVMTLQILDTESEQPPIVLAENIGRCFEALKPGVVTFTIEQDEQHHLYALDTTGSFTSLGITLPKGVQDYVWFDQAHVMVGQNSSLVLVNADKTKELVDLEDLGVSGITRLALSPDKTKIAIVYNRTE